MMLWDWLVDSNFDVVLNGLSVNVVACAVLDCSWDAGYHGGLANIIAFTADRRLAAAPDIKHRHAAPYFIIHKMRVSALTPSFPAKTSCVSGSIWCIHYHIRPTVCRWTCRQPSFGASDTVRAWCIRYYICALVWWACHQPSFGASGTDLARCIRYHMCALVGGHLTNCRHLLPVTMESLLSSGYLTDRLLVRPIPYTTASSDCAEVWWVPHQLS